ncbi:endonuclease [Fulvivirga sp. 29W222]|uniref:Endonuclease n=1 Tax=Fulvivirga marina TaxID=2494733 RepID=A0A937KED5_9BACT|nr:endonuclease [Fulvivirga marina]MBL6449627.1 endonuclease [Fulvivirga marina]
MKRIITSTLKGLMACTLVLFYFIGNAQIPPGYYNNAEGKSGDPLKSALYNIIKGHVEYPYTSSSTDVWDILKETDRDPNNPNNVIGIYSNFSMNAALEYNSGDGWSREHVWAKSRGDFGTTLGPGTDVHHLRAADISTNSARSNRTFAECSELYVDGSGTYQGATASYTSSTSFVWKPRNEVKGDIARMIFYMATRYEGFNGEPDLEIVDYVVDAADKSPLHGKLSDLLAWHNEDPVDNLERQRNDIIYGYQQNRNPYIDHPEYVGLIWGEVSSEPTTPSFTSTPDTGTVAGDLYAYNITTTGGQGTLSITASQKPEWLSLTDNGNGTALLTGTASDSDEGDHIISVSVTDGVATDTQSYILTVSLGNTGGGASELFISEYIEGSSYNKALEIANFTGSDIDLSGYSIHKQTNGSGSWSSGLSLTGILAHGDVFVIAHSSATSEITSLADIITGSSEMTFNGNDAIALFKGGALIDLLGAFNDAAIYAQDVTLVRGPSIYSPNTTFTTNEWDTYATDTFAYLGTHIMNGSTPANQLPSVSVTSPANNSTFNEGDVISIAATAADSDGVVSKVAFYQNGNLLGEDTSEPYTFNWTNATAGTYAITAIATDNENSSATSPIINIVVQGQVAMNPMVSTINLSTEKRGKSFEGQALIQLTSNNVNLTGAYVEVTWRNSSGTYVEHQYGYTSNSGILFRSSKLEQTDFTISIDQVSKEGYYWDENNSEVTKSVQSAKQEPIARKAITANAVAESLAIFPNPFEHVTDIKVHTTDASDINIRIYSMEGKTLEKYSYSVKEGEYLFPVGNALPKGVFMAEVTVNGDMEIIRIVKY